MRKQGTAPQQGAKTVDKVSRVQVASNMGRLHNGSASALQAECGSSILPRSTMKDGFKNPITIGDKVVFNMGGKYLATGRIAKLYPSKPVKDKKKYTSPDRVAVKITSHNASFSIDTVKDLIVYASNVMFLTSMPSTYGD